MTDLPKPGITRNIGDLGIIGNLRSAAPVARDTTIDYFCWPDIDNPSVFVALLDSEQAGLFSLQPDWPDARLQQLYLPDTNILQTRCLSQQGARKSRLIICRLATIWSRLPLIIRRLQVLKGRVSWRRRCAPMSDYASARLDATLNDVAITLVTKVSRRCDWSPTLRWNVKITPRQRSLRSGRASRRYLFSAVPTTRRPVAVDHTDILFAETLHYSQRWAAHSNYRGRWREMVNRSAVALKLLTSARHGSLAAATTFGLPETPRGERNWDYRTSWRRDASFSVYALMPLGYTDEGESIQPLGRSVYGQQPFLSEKIAGGLPSQQRRRTAGSRFTSPDRLWRRPAGTHR